MFNQIITERATSFQHAMDLLDSQQSLASESIGTASWLEPEEFSQLLAERTACRVTDYRYRTSQHEENPTYRYSTRDGRLVKRTASTALA